MRGLALLMLLGLAGCAAVQQSTASAVPDVGGWQTPAGTPPTRAELAALVAACQDKVKTTVENAPMDSCLADLGLHRI
jgi:hypothetical protein